MGLRAYCRAATVLVAAGAAMGLAGSVAGLPLVGVPGAAASQNAGSAEIVKPSGGAPLSSGGSKIAFTFKLPNGSACTGDSSLAGYRVNGYIIPQSVVLDSLRFDSDGPVPVAGQFRGPMWDTGTSPYVQKLTAVATPTGGPGPIIQPLPAFNFAVYDTTRFPVMPGVYNVGIACTRGAPGSATQLDKYWNTTMTIAADPGDDGPAKIRWEVANVAPLNTGTKAPTGWIALGAAGLFAAAVGTSVVRRRRHHPVPAPLSPPAKETR